MEQDLEELVRKSWEDPNQDPSQPTRQQRAEASRKLWLELDTSGKASEEAASAGKRGSDATAPAATPELDAKAQLEQEQEAAQRAARARPHPNMAIRDFVHLHTEEEPVLDAEDPHTIAHEALPEESRGSSPDQDHGAGSILSSAEVDPEANPEGAAARALGTRSLQAVRRREVEAAKERWSVAEAHMQQATQDNNMAVAQLGEWHTSQEAQREAKHSQLVAARERLRGAFQGRLDKQVALKTAVGDADLMDSENMQSLLEAAREAGVQTWDAQLVESADVKLRCLQDFGALKSTLGGSLEADAQQPAIRILEERTAKARKALGEAKDRSLPLSPDLHAEEQLAQASDLLDLFDGLRNAVQKDTFDGQPDVTPLQGFLTSAAGKEQWDAALVAQAELKVQALQTLGALRSVMTASQGQTLEAAAKVELSNNVESAKDLLAQIQKAKSIVLPSMLNAEELLGQAEELLR